MRSGFLPARVVHVHPTRACNLACAHCYSGSSPNIRTSLDAELLLEALQELRQQGYEILSVSGGEPLVYRGLSTLLRGAIQCGYRIHLVTNGLLLTRDRLRSLQEYLHFVAVSFDGARDVHNRVRGRLDAFAKADAALDVLACGEVPFGLAFGASRRSLSDIPWAYERAREVGAALLHLRPLVWTGRARELDNGWVLNAEDCARLIVLRDLLDRGPASTPRIQVDLLAARELDQAREQFPAFDAPAQLTLLSDVVNPLVIDDAGRLLPFTYGIHPAFVIGSLTGGYKEAIACYRTDGVSLTLALLEAAFSEARQRQFEHLDWFAHLTDVSERLGGGVAE